MLEQDSHHIPMWDEIKKHRLQLLVTIINRSGADKAIGLLREKHMHFHFAFLAKGTASSEIMDLLGLGDEDKTVVLCLSSDFAIPRLMEELNQKAALAKAGKGIAFTIPLSGVSSPVLQLMSQELQHEVQSDMEKEVDKMSMHADHDLIIAVINQGYSDDLMVAAKAAGATGGTVIHARRIGLEEAVKFFGIPIQAEKEIVAILTSRDTKAAIMKAISKSCGMKTDARGIVFSLPVDNVAGLELGEMASKDE